MRDDRAGEAESAAPAQFSVFRIVLNSHRVHRALHQYAADRETGLEAEFFGQHLVHPVDLLPVALKKLQEARFRLLTFRPPK